MSPTKFYHVIQIILYIYPCDQSLVTLALLWKKLTKSQFYKDLTRKTAFFKGWGWFKFNNLGLALGTNLKFYTSVAKGLKLKVRKFLGLIPTFLEVTGEKLVGGGGGILFCPPFWIGSKCLLLRLFLAEFCSFWCFYLILCSDVVAVKFSLLIDLSVLLSCCILH